MVFEVIYSRVNQFTLPLNYEYHLKIILDGILYEANIKCKDFYSKVIHINYLRDILLNMNFGWNIETYVSIEFDKIRDYLYIMIEIFSQEVEPKEDSIFKLTNQVGREKFILSLKKSKGNASKVLQTEKWMVEKLLAKYEKDKPQFYCPQVLDRIVEKTSNFDPVFHFSYATYTINGFITLRVNLYTTDICGARKLNTDFIRYLYSHPKFQVYQPYFQDLSIVQQLMLPDLFIDDSLYQRNIELLNMDILVYAGIDKYRLIHPKLLKLFLYDLDNLVLYGKEKLLQTNILLALYEVNLEFAFMGRVIVPAPMFYRYHIRIVDHPNPKFHQKFKTKKYGKNMDFEACSDYQKRIIYHPLIGYYKFEHPF